MRGGTKAKDFGIQVWEAFLFAWEIEGERDSLNCHTPGFDVGQHCDSLAINDRDSEGQINRLNGLSCLQRES